MATKTVNCECQTWSFGNYGEDGSAESFEDYGTGCTQTTTKVFAQGHDAKLVGFLVRAELADEEIGKVEGGMRMTYQNAVHAAGTISEALAAKAQAQLDAVRARLAKKAASEAKKTARKSAKKAEVTSEPEAQPVWRSAKIKVGRWTYEAQIEIATGDATYATKLGGTKMVEQGQYSEV